MRSEEGKKNFRVLLHYKRKRQQDTTRTMDKQWEELPRSPENKPLNPYRNPQAIPAGVPSLSGPAVEGFTSEFSGGS
jgi:hypothetical protein